MLYYEVMVKAKTVQTCTLSCRSLGVNLNDHKNTIKIHGKNKKKT